MLYHATLPSRPNLLALCGQQLTVRVDEIWRGVCSGSPAAIADMVNVYLPRLDHYLHAGLGVPHANVRDAIMTEAVMTFAEQYEIDHLSRLEVRLYQAVRMGASAAGLAPRHPSVPPAGPKRLALGLELLKRNVRSAIAGAASCQSREGSDVVAFAARVASAGAAAPVWFAESGFLTRIARARAIYTTLIEVASGWAPPHLTVNEQRARGDEIRQTFHRVWLALPLATREARTLWGLNVSVADVAEILSISIAAADSALLQLLTLITAFNTLIGRPPEQDAPEGALLSGLGFPAAECR